MNKLPELLSPAGSFDALEAAVEGGADAVYFAGENFGARAFAKNFTRDEITQAATLCRACGVKSYVTLNTLVLDRELRDALDYAAFLENAGIDALIIADMGAAQIIHRHIPSMKLHASTQFSGHNAYAAKLLADCGFERMVAARELSYENLKTLCETSPIEIETFIHGALCVCHSGQCLFSSMVGGRSGNRGQCAQPCRLPDKGGRYPLSLKDLSMASRIDKLLDCGAASLKIEGRMKSPEYVLGVTRIYRRLLSERRNANSDEISELSELFSRGGFTTGYFDNKVNSDMLGTRSESDIEKSRAAEKFGGITRKEPLTLSASLKANENFTLSVSGRNGSVTVKGNIPETAKTAPLDSAALEKNLQKLGGTPFCAEKTECDIEDGLILRVSEINALRREAVSAYEQLGVREHTFVDGYQPLRVQKSNICFSTALVMRGKNLPESDEFFKAFDIVFLPLAEYFKCGESRVNGIALPGVISDSETGDTERMLKSAYEKGARHALCGNYGHLELAKNVGFTVHGDFRLNITNSEAADFAFAHGFTSLILSPELTSAQLRDIGGNTRAFVYGRVPMMLLEKCVSKEISGCDKCENDASALTDRRGVRFPILREEPHRNIIFNSVPTYSADKMPTGGSHFLFSVETSAEIMRIVHAYEKHLPPNGDIRRIKD